MTRLLCLILGFLIGLTFHVSYRAPYYEMRGAIVIEQRVLGLGFAYTWCAPGFHYPPEWGWYDTRISVR